MARRSGTQSHNPVPATAEQVAFIATAVVAGWTPPAGSQAEWILRDGGPFRRLQFISRSDAQTVIDTYRGTQ